MDEDQQASRLAFPHPAHLKLKMDEDDIFMAVEDRDVEWVRDLVGDGVNPEVVDVAGRTPLQHASLDGCLPLVRFFVEEAQVNVEKTDRCRRTALHLACRWDDLEVVQYLIETGGANTNAKDIHGDTPLHVATQNDCTEVVTYIVESGQQANNLINATNRNGHTALDDALLFRMPHIFRYLLPRTSSIAVRTLEDTSLRHDTSDIRRVVLEKYAFGRGLADAFRRNPIGTLLSSFPLCSPKAFAAYILTYPPYVLSILDEQGRLPIHIAFSLKKETLKSPAMFSLIALLFEREPRSALARDPTTGLYPHETAADLLSKDVGRHLDYADEDEARWLDVVYEMLRLNPEQVLQSRSQLQRPCLPNQEESGGVQEPAGKRPKLENGL